MFANSRLESQKKAIASYANEVPPTLVDETRYLVCTDSNGRRSPFASFQPIATSSVTSQQSSQALICNFGLLM